MTHKFDDEMLVAYLDGELPSEQKASIDQNLQIDGGLQQRVSSLRATWDLLGDLPLQEPRADLAQSTIEIVTLAMEKESRTWWRWGVENRWLALGLSGLMMLAAGAAASRALTNYATRQIIANLPAIVDYPSLEYIDSVEFLEKLSQIPNLVEAAGTNSGRSLIGDGIVPAELAQRRAWIESLQDQDRGRLENNLRDYRPQSKQVQSRLRTITEKIYADRSQTGKYLEAIRAYSAILDKLGIKLKNLLKRMQTDERIVAIKERVTILMALKYTPSVMDGMAFRSWLDDLQYREENIDLLYYDPDSRIINDLLYRDPSESVVTPEDIRDLIENRLSPTAAKLLRELPDESTLRFHLGYWISCVVQSNSPPEVPSVDVDLEQKFRGLPPDKRGELEFLPEDEVRSLLRSGLPTSPPNA